MRSAARPGSSKRQRASWPNSLRAARLGRFRILLPLLSRARVCGPVVHDARIAALCLAHGVEVLLTRDRDFSFFPELSTENPFAAL